MPGSTDILAGLSRIGPELEALYRDLHSHPELGHAEHRTSNRVARLLTDCGYDVRDGIGDTGVAGVLANGDGPVVLVRADMDALPIEERTGLSYASATTAPGEGGTPQPVMHACGHDVHVTCLLGAARLMAESRDAWNGTLVALFQCAEETGDGADAMVADGLTDRVPRPEVCLAQHVLPMPAGRVGTRSGPVLSAADNYRITVHGRGAHGSQPQASVDPVVIASMIVVRLQTIVSREIGMLTPAVVTVGSVHAGTNPNNVPESARMEINVRTYDEDTRAKVRAAIERIAKAECAAADTPKPPDIERFGGFPPTVNDEATTGKVARAFARHFGDRATTLDLQTASEDFSEIPKAFGVPYTYWGIGGTDPDQYARAVKNGTLDSDVPVNHSARFAPVVQPTIDTGVRAIVVAAAQWLTRAP
ncbi:hippurate hydrolase [Marinactinospora thermotolerans DSM 45154]|uniref:Hippurate hydrolase n=1 Tax=Marinactinospora thermotolerans DSM 45154 TaxID=1122192 RepID=A0A1T4PFC2_9ACTN|nr:amidohydrolase [Marinactinospora thermotolerans]SJZ89926.1 hippurate hydrolase [Marinactinospora thermotolerans DSM 45154]